MKIKKLIALLLLVFIFTRFSAESFLYKDRNDTSPKVLQEHVPLAWPTAGQTAIGTVEDGLLARSSANEKVLPIASIAKVITALAVMEKQPFRFGYAGETYTITDKDIAGLNAYISQGGSVLPIRIGMKVTQYQAMQRMLIASDNSISDILVQRIFGSRKAYVSYAQNMMKRMGFSKTAVADPSGFSPSTVSTPSEVVAIGIAALKSHVIATIVAQQQAEIPVAGTIRNTNQLPGSDGVIGIKTGTTNKAASCLLFAAHYTVKNGQKGTIVGVILGDKNHRSLYMDSRDLLASAKQCFGLTEAQSTLTPGPFAESQDEAKCSNNQKQ